MTGILTRTEILELCKIPSEHGGLTIRPLHQRDALQPTSYDVAIGLVISTKASQDKQIIGFELIDKLDNGESVGVFESVEIESYGFRKFVSAEFFEFPNDLIGHVYLRSGFARRGLIPLYLGRIEAGWRGRLIIEIFNASREAIRIRRAERLITLEFIRLSKPVKEGYKGEFQDFGSHW